MSQVWNPKLVFWHTESLLVFYNNIVFVLFCQSRSFNPSLCHLLHFFFAHSKYKASKYIDNETKKTNDNCNTYAMKPYYIFTVGWEVKLHLKKLTEKKFLLSYFAVSRLLRLSEIYPNRASWTPQYPPPFSLKPHVQLFTRWLTLGVLLFWEDAILSHSCALLMKTK